MKIFNRNKETRSTEEVSYDPLVGHIDLLLGNGYKKSKALKLSTVYRAVDVISSSIAVLPANTFQYNGNWKYKEYNDLYYLLNVQPNSLMGAYTFKKQIVQYMLLKGNAYILITRDKNNTPSKLKLLDSDYVKVYVDDKNDDLSYEYKGTNYDSADIIHIMNHSENGLIGISTLEYAAMSLDTSYASEEHANNFHRGGGNMAGILTPDHNNVNPTKLAKTIETIKEKLGVNSGGVSNSIIALDAAMKYQPIKISPKDSQLLESRQFNFVTICQFFGVPPSKVFDLTKSSYASVEASQIDFLSSTIQPLVEKIENEMFRKLYTKIDYGKTELKFDVSNLLRLDATSQADYFTKMHSIGALTTNEIREKIDAPSPSKGGNRAFIQTNLQPLDNLVVEGGKDSKITDNQIKPNKDDNK